MLENGIVLTSVSREPDLDLKYDYLNEIFNTDCSDISKEICYWHRCQGLRNDIVAYLRVNYSNRVNTTIYYLDTSDIFNIYQILLSWNDKKKWKKYSKSIWTWKEIKPQLQEQLRRLTFLLGIMQGDKSFNNNCKVYFYDSY